MEEVWRYLLVGAEVAVDKSVFGVMVVAVIYPKLILDWDKFIISALVIY
jgi:hypothetical protein